MTVHYDEVEAAHRERLPRMKRSKTGIGSFYTHKWVVPSEVATNVKAGYRVPRRQHEVIYPPEVISRALRSVKGADRKRILGNVTKYYGKKVAV